MRSANEAHCSTGTLASARSGGPGGNATVGAAPAAAAVAAAVAVATVVGVVAWEVMEARVDAVIGA